MEEPFEKIITTLFESLEQSSTHANTAELAEAFLDNAPFKLNNADSFSVIASTSIIRPAEKIIEKAAECSIIGYNDLPKKIQHKIKRLWVNYQQAEHWLSQFITVTSGTGCCSSDKARYILSLYEKDLRGENILIPDSRDWYMPEFGRTKDWLNLVDAVIYNNPTDAYLGSLFNIISESLLYHNDSNDTNPPKTP